MLSRENGIVRAGRASGVEIRGSTRRSCVLRVAVCGSLVWAVLLSPMVRAQVVETAADVVPTSGSEGTRIVASLRDWDAARILSSSANDVLLLGEGPLGFFGRVEVVTPAFVAGRIDALPIHPARSSVTVRFGAGREVDVSPWRGITWEGAAWTWFGLMSLGTVFAVVAILGGLVRACHTQSEGGLAALERQLYLLFAFVLAIFLGFELISKVPSQLHTPLMSGANAISGITIVGALILAGLTESGLIVKVLGFLAVVTASINVVGGYLVTNRMLGMFTHKGGAGS